MLHFPEWLTWQYVITRGLAHFALGFWLSFITALIIWLILYRKGKLGGPPAGHFFFKRFNFYLFPALISGLTGGLANNLVDVDHLVIFFGHSNGRILHTPFLIAALGFSIYYGIRVAALLMGNIWEDRKTVIKTVIKFTAALSVVSHVAEDYLLGWF